MANFSNVVIVGAGHSGARLAGALRSRGHEGPITLLGCESDLPYDRPPLSKAVLTEAQPLDSFQLYSEDFYRQNEVTLQRDTQVVRIDRDRKAVEDAAGKRTPYGVLVLATGAEPRRLTVPGAHLDGVHVLRSHDDAVRLRADLTPGCRVVTIGAGFIGLEVAASAVSLGCSVTVLELMGRALERAIPYELADRLVGTHRAHGVDVRFNARVTGIEGEQRVSGVRLADGTMLACDVVVVGIGVLPRVALAEQAGLAVDNGIRVDQYLRTSDPSIYAIGDASIFPSSLLGGPMRLECWKNAEQQAEVAAANILGEARAMDALPWFWSDQYDLTVQVAGLPGVGVRTVVRDLGEDAAIYFSLDRRGRLVGASAVGSLMRIGKEMRMAQMLIGTVTTFEPADLENARVSLRQFLTGLGSGSGQPA